MPDEEPYNPLDIEHLGESVADAMLERPVVAIKDLAPFDGAGVYAIYYTGDAMPFAAYESLAERNRAGRFEAPMYVGKAVPMGARKGKRVASTTGQALFRRLSEHAQSIQQAGNLGVDDFYCRYLVVLDIWIPLGESLAIERFRPLWNVIVDGFGNHDPGKGRYQGQRPMWDTLHPGRPWAARLSPNRQSVDDILALIQAALAGHPVEMLSPEAQTLEADSDEE